MSILEVPSAALGTGSSDCAPPSPVSRDKFVRRFAQDDVFVASWRSKQSAFTWVSILCQTSQRVGAAPLAH